LGVNIFPSFPFFVLLGLCGDEQDEFDEFAADLAALETTEASGGSELTLTSILGDEGVSGIVLSVCKPDQ
jgi:hypothetical protein